MEAEYRSLTSLRGHITRGLNYMTDALTSDAGVRYLELQSASLEKRWNSYESRWDIFVDKYIDESGHDEREARHIDLQDKYHEIQLKLSLYMKQFSPISQSNPHGSTNSMIKVKLPEIKLKEFSGDPLDWTRFWNQFSTSIHLKKDIDDVTKYVYLTQCIKGNAQKLLAGFKGEASDYGDAIKALTEMYGDPKKIRRTLLRSLINLGKPKYVRSEIFDFKVDLENLLMQIGHDSEIDVSSNEMILRELIVLKLPKEVEDFMFGLYKTMYFSVSQIKEGLQHLLNFMEHENKGNANKGTPEVNKIRFQSPAKPSSPFKGSSTVGTYTTLSNYSCIYCKGKHRPFDCTIYSSLNARRERLKVLNRCIKCTKVHQSTECATILNMCPHCRRGKHHSFLCISSPGSVGTPNIGKSTVTSKDINSDKLNGDPVTTNQVISIINKQSSHQNYSVALPTAMVTVRSEDGQLISVRCLFDSGSQRSFIHKDLVHKLSLRTVSTVNMILNSFDGMGDSRDYEIVNPVVSLGNRKKRVTLIVVKDMPEPIITPGLCDTMKDLDKIGYHLADRDIKSDRIDNIKMLIGADFLGNYLSGMRQVNNVDLLESPGGYLVYGLIPHRGTDHIHCNSALVARVSVELGENAPLLVDPRTISSAVVDDTLPVHKLWDLDVVGIIPSQVSQSDVETISKYETTVLHRNGRYWVELPFKHNHPFLPTNYNVALGQMYNQLKRFQHQPDHLKCYDNIIKEQLKLGFIEEVENPVISPNTHYLPHHAVRKNSSTPLRVVYNCSAKPSKSSASLNDCLMTGPSLTEKLFDLLVRFRMNKFACIADIERAFLQIGLQQHHRDFTRFLWLEDPFDENSRVKTYRFKSVLFGATCSPFLLQMTLQYHFQRSHSPYSGVLLSSFYVDNFQHNADNEQQLVELYDVANAEMSKAGMNLRQWNSNSKLLKDHISQNTEESLEFPLVDKILGLSWELSSDSLFVNLCKFETLQYVTKRQLLSLVSSCFDPLGMCVPILIKGKILIQEAWKENIGWDVKLPPSFLDRWNTLACELSELPTFKFPRCICWMGDSYRLHVFVDASTTAYGAVCYLSNNNQSNFVASKARVTPLKTRTIPQLEITALQLGTQFACCIRDLFHHFFIEEVIIWSDSEVALQWLKNNKCKITYVQNRVAQIKEIGSSFKFLYVSTKENPADLLTRGISITQFRKSRLWTHGPSWLSCPEKWPEQRFLVMICEIVSEIVPEVPIPEPIFDYNNYSSLRKLLNVTRIVYNFIMCVKSGIRLVDPLVYWIRYVQDTHYPRICAFLRKELNGLEQDKLQFIKDIGLYYDESTGLVHSRGRLHHSNLDQSTKFPILIPSKSHLANLLIDFAHEKCLHGGVKETLSYLRRQYWIPKVISTIKKFLRHCVNCKRVEGRRFDYPGPPPLPAVRVQFTRPFFHTGIDFSGPITITKTEDGKPHKYYIVLFTCTASRLVHLELAYNMSALTFINIFRRFCAIYSAPVTVISDNGSNFLASAKFFDQLLMQRDVKEYMAVNHIQWRFIAPRAPWQGGFYERLIGLTKSCLKKVLFKKRVNADELETVLKEIQCKLNNRPLTYIDAETPIEPLAPIHLWCGRIINPMPSVELDSQEDPNFLDHSEFNKRYSQVSVILNHFENMWRNEYLTALREKHYGGSQACQDKAPLVGDVVIVERPGPQHEWPLGRIVKLYPDKENIIRVVDVLYNGSISKRTIDKLVPLEIHSPLINSTIVQGEESQPNVSGETKQIHGDSVSEVRPLRKAALKAAKLRQYLIDNDQI
ncbi:uncharacterized protein [Palaemon carinicauda]|uniref:uncharacterized protein n=1 Tax=Palaemon carinicauda TaxID=392227 RepID=UPI0035B5D7C5